MFEWLKLIDTKVWLYLAVALAVAAYTGAVYHAGGAGPRAELAGLESRVQLAHDTQVAEDGRREREHKKLIQEKDNDRVESEALTVAAFSAYVASLRAPASVAGEDKKPIPITSERCDDPAADKAISAAVQGFRDEVRAAVADFRDEVAGSLEEAQKNTDALIRVQKWGVGEQEINR